mmetsp:Transcript_52894/g.137834  ORF Transcript_52894/g.137834 Transcript_52894/m.137834 type:complete len:86 (+) Transcript_52894:522-779(+)
MTCTTWIGPAWAMAALLYMYVLRFLRVWWLCMLVGVAVALRCLPRVLVTKSLLWHCMKLLLSRDMVLHLLLFGSLVVNPLLENCS